MTCIEPKAKKRKTEQPEEVDDDEGVEEVGEDEVEDPELEDDEEEAGDEDDDEPEATTKSGPAESAKARKGKTVPKEDDLNEVLLEGEDGEEE